MGQEEEEEQKELTRKEKRAKIKSDHLANVNFKQILASADPLSKEFDSFKNIQGCIRNLDPARKGQHAKKLNRITQNLTKTGSHLDALYDFETEPMSGINSKVNKVDGGVAEPSTLQEQMAAFKVQMQEKLENIKNNYGNTSVKMPDAMN